MKIPNPVADRVLGDGLVTLTSAGPAVPAGVMAVIEVAIPVPPPVPTTTDVAGTPSNVTVAFVAKLVPVIVTAVLPALAPLAGVTEMTFMGFAMHWPVLESTISSPMQAVFGSATRDSAVL